MIVVGCIVCKIRYLIYICGTIMSHKMRGSLKLSTEELKRRPDLCAVDGRLYDLTAFAKVHPGGDVIQAAGGYDATALYFSMHMGQLPMNSELLQQFYEGTHVKDSAQSDPSYSFDSPFAKDLQQSVRKAMGASSWYAPAAFWVRTLLICLLTLVCEYMWITTGSALAAICVGCMHALIGLCVQHDASHGAMSKNPSINALFAYGADWIGNSRWIWLQQHILWHHAHTNHQLFDPDASSAEPLLVFSDYSVNSTGKKPVTPVLKFQDYITHFVLALYGPSIVYNGAALWSLKHNDHIPFSVSSGAFMAKQRYLAIAFRLFYLLRITIAPWYFGGASLVISALLVSISTGICLTFLFVVSHNFEGSDRDPLKLHPDNSKSKNAKKPICWYKSQVETSCTYGGNFAMISTGGLNFQIEHHLFPRLSSWYYPRIQDAVRACCERHGVKYTYYPSLWANTGSMLRYMRKVGVVAVLAHAD